MAFKDSKGLTALDAAPSEAGAVRTLPAALQNEFNFICSRIGREDKLSASTAQLTRYDEIRALLQFDPAATDWENLRARMNALGGCVIRTHPDDGPVKYLLADSRDYGCFWSEDTVAEAIACIEKEEIEWAPRLDYARKLAAWRDGVAARKARKAARDAAKAVAA